MLSVWHPDCENFIDRRRFDHSSPEDLIATLCGIIYEQAKNKYDLYLKALDVANQFQYKRPKAGYRKDFFKRSRSQLINAWLQWSQSFEKNMKSHLEFIHSEGWPKGEIPELPWK